MLPREVDAARAAGRRILYVSAGTVATGRLWNEKFGPKAGWKKGEGSLGLAILVDPVFGVM